ncbi:MAG: arylsulfatase [Acidobacteriota bacterium]
MNSQTQIGRRLRPVLMAILSVALPAQAQPDRRKEVHKPNIIFILADDLGYAELGSYGQKKIRTPHLDRMAKEGMRFTQFYAGNAVCAPSRCVLMTGRHGGHAFIHNNREVEPEGQHPIPEEAVTVAELLKDQGYATAAMGKWGLGPPGSTGDPNRQGFDEFFGYNCQRQAHNFYPRYLWKNDAKVSLQGNEAGLTGAVYSHDVIELQAQTFIRKNQDKPFFLYLPFTIPHLALQVPEDSLKAYLGLWEDPPYDGGKGYLPHPHPRAAYAAMVTRLDRTVGRILELLKELGLEDKTLVMFSSDNGPTYDRLGGSDSEFFESAGPFRGLKGSLYEGGIRVPFLARWTGRIAAGAVNDLPLAFYDLLPTLCEVAGSPVPDNLDGVSFLPTLLSNSGQKPHLFLYWEFSGYGGQQALRLGDWKGVRQNLETGVIDTELYNLARDPGETQNLAELYPEIVRRIESLMADNHQPSTWFPIAALDKDRTP